MALYRPELWVQSGYPGDYTCTFKTAFYVESDPGAVTQVIISRNWNGAAEGIVLYYDNTADQMSVVWFTGGGSTFEQAVLGSRPAINQQCIAYLQSSSTTVKGGWAPISSPTSWTSNQTPNPLPAHGSNNAISLTSNANGAYMTAQNWCGWNELLSESTLSGEIYSTAVYRTNLVFEHKLNDGDVTSPWTDTSGNGNTATQQGGLAPTNRTNFLADYGVGMVGVAIETDTALALQSFNAADVGDLFIFGDDGFESSMGGLKVFGGFPAATVASGPVGLAAETDTALALAGVQRRAVGLAAETDTALARTAVSIRATGLSTETDTALALAAVALKAAGLSAETDQALALLPAANGSVGLAVESDVAIPRGAARPAGVAAESNVALALSGVSVRAVGAAVESNLALALVPRQVRTVGVAIELDAALSLGGSAGTAVGLAAESDAALPRGSARPAAAALETDTALGLAASLIRQAGLAAEADVALALAGVQLRAVGLASEEDSALRLFTPGALAVGMAIEFEVALALAREPLEDWAPSGRARIGAAYGKPSGRIGAAYGKPSGRIGAAYGKPSGRIGDDLL